MICYASRTGTRRNIAALAGAGWGWRWFAVRRQMARAAALREKMMRRERFAGVVRLPGTTKTAFIDKDEG